MADEEKTAEETMIFDPSQKKKKKKSKKTAFDLDAALAGESQPSTEKPPEGGNEALDMVDVKQALPDEDTAADLDEEFSLTSKKKKKDKKVKISDMTQILGENEEPVLPIVQEGEYATTDDDYTYDQLLTRVFNIMKERNPEMESGERKRFIMKPPQLARVGTKKTAFTNYGDLCRQLKRQPKHLLQFLLAELGTSGNVDANNSLILKGRYQQKHIETVLRRYIKEYVQCHTCKSPESLLEREIRLFFLKCQNCGSRSSVASIKSGFQAVTGKRAAMRAKTG